MAIGDDFAPEFRRRLDEARQFRSGLQSAAEYAAGDYANDLDLTIRVIRMPGDLYRLDTEDRPVEPTETVVAEYDPVPF